MTHKEIEVYMKNIKHVTHDYKVEWNADRYHVCQKMFAMAGENKEGDKILTLKMPPEEGAYLRDTNKAIIEGYYMNKVHWISLILDKIDDILVKELIDRSYYYFITTLPKKLQKML